METKVFHFTGNCRKDEKFRQRRHGVVTLSTGPAESKTTEAELAEVKPMICILKSGSMYFVLFVCAKLHHWLTKSFRTLIDDKYLCKKHILPASPDELHFFSSTACGCGPEWLCVKRQHISQSISNTTEHFWRRSVDVEWMAIHSTWSASTLYSSQCQMSTGWKEIFSLHRWIGEEIFVFFFQENENNVKCKLSKWQ